MLGRQRSFEPQWGTRTVQVLAPTVAVLTGDFATNAQSVGGESWDDADGVVTFVAVREQTGWRVVSWHTTE